MSMEVAQPLLLSKERVLVPPWWELTSMDDFQVLNFSSKLSRNFCFIENAFVIPTIYQGTGLSGNENWFKMKGKLNPGTKFKMIELHVSECEHFKFLSY